MKKSFRLLSSIVLAATMVFGLFSSSIFASDANSLIDKVPDALNPQLEKQKLIELQKQASKGNSLIAQEEGRLYVHPDKPLVINFDDGSSITYTSKVTTNAARSTTYTLEKAYTYLLGYAYIEGEVAGVSLITFDNNDRGYELANATASQAVNDTGFAEVSFGDSQVKKVYLGLYASKFRARHKGTITYEFSGVKKQQSYDLIWESNPNDGGTPYIVTSW
ncbi:hypothetical protein J2T12_004505 [Paenibacillus anaericanus]|uniref:hypothetical protein n=1 Tax=Paenibacillus anaericanus TaxID=170367 RepID=UPI002786318F|nr:hypothetical protein [Paenibacillus anaericanus]MDQ0091079.1 hypothetical protein [Paenibacillus anaericanus]